MDLDLVRKIFSEPQEIIGKDKFFNSAVLVSLVTINDENHFLFEKRAAEIRQGGEISFPGGKFDDKKDNSYQDTAVRETVEELGIDVNKIELLGKMGTLVAPMGITVDPYIAVLKINSTDDLKIDTREVEKVFTIPVSYFLENKPDMYHINVRAHPSDVDDSGNKIELLPVK
ncbi:MAG: CoA pyrophosphatase, partial [Ignavibacteria bacterium]|nr:CoA pyrophosphatase [Ignavibacteria bacterium]